MKSYQRAVVALIRASGARIKILSDHRLVDLWREYCARQYQGGWIAGSQPEVRRFLVWANGRTGLSREIEASERDHARGIAPRVRTRRHYVQVWGGRFLVERRLQV